MKSKREKLVGVGLGAGFLGAVLLGLKYAIRPPTKARVPDAISPGTFATKVLHTSLGTMVFHEAGSGRPLVFVHAPGMGASSYEWSKVYPAFADGYRVMALDLIGFGESARPGGRMTAAEHARTLAEFLRALCDGPATLVGSGLGGGFCAHMASQHPELTDHLILHMPTGLRDFARSRIPLSTRLMGGVPLLNRFLYRNHKATRAGLRSLLARTGFADAEKITEEMLDVYTTCAQQAGAEHALINLLTGNLAFDLEARLKGLPHRVSLLWGEQAHFPPLEWAYRWHGMLPNSTLAILPGCGFLAALENPEAVIEAVRSALDARLRVVA